MVGARGPQDSVLSLEVHGLSMEFSGVEVLHDVELAVKAGEVRAFLGSNGSGKSTLIKILSGYHRPKGGATVAIGDRLLKFGSSLHSYRLGCRVIQQEGDLIGDLSVIDNFCLTGGYPSRWGTVRTRTAQRRAADKLDLLELAVNPRSLVSDLTMAERTGVALARALRDDDQFPVKLLILDEPSATMPTHEVMHMTGIVRRVAEQGVGVLYVSHRLAETFQVADSVTVIRDGRIIVTSDVAEQTEASLAALITGYGIEPVGVGAAKTVRSASNAAVLDVSSMSAGVMKDISFSAHRGEVLGIAGLTGSGRESLLGTLFGASARSGAVTVDDHELPPQRPDIAVAMGVAFVVADRKALGGAMDLSARENISLVRLAPFWRRGWLRGGNERREAQEWFKRLQISPSDGVELPLATFSGGNQQKVMFAKWLRVRPKVFLLDEPTQGADVAAKAEIHRMILDIAQSNTAVVVSSSDVEELVALSDRVLVLRDGTLVEEIVRPHVSARNVTMSALGVSGAPESVSYT